MQQLHSRNVASMDVSRKREDRRSVGLVPELDFGIRPYLP